MDNDEIYAIVAAIVVIEALIWGLERYLRQVFAPHDSKQTPLYQGGEYLQSRPRRYEMDQISFTMFFMILHVVGFFGASLYIIQQAGINYFSWPVLGFGAITLYTTIFIGAATRGS